MQNFFGVSEHDGRGKKYKMDCHLPFDMLHVFVLNINECLKQVNAGDTHERAGKLYFQCAGIHFLEPLGAVFMRFNIHFADECGIAANDNHDEKVGNHGDVNEGENTEHEFGFGDGFHMNHHVI